MDAAASDLATQIESRHDEFDVLTDGAGRTRTITDDSITALIDLVAKPVRAG